MKFCVFEKNSDTEITVKTLFFFLFSNKMGVIKAGIHKMLVRIVNRKDPDQTGSV